MSNRIKCNDAADLHRLVAALEAAIRQHRSTVWGDGPVEHEADQVLYGVLRKDGER